MHLSRNQLLILAVLAFSSFGFAQSEDLAADTTLSTTTSCAPPTYDCARTDLIKTNNLNPPPTMSKRNTIVTPSDFKLPIVRATDGTFFERRTLTTTVSGSNGDNIFNVDDTYFLVIDDGGSTYPVSFNPSTMQVLNTAPWKFGVNQVRWDGSGSFSRVSRNAVYAVPASDTTIPGVKTDGITL